MAITTAFVPWPLVLAAAAVASVLIAVALFLSARVFPAAPPYRGLRRILLGVFSALVVAEVLLLTMGFRALAFLSVGAAAALLGLLVPKLRRPL